MIFVTKRGEVADCLASPSCPLLPSLLIRTQGLLLVKEACKPLRCNCYGLDDLDDFDSLDGLDDMHILLIK